jgi:hypothetical protein
MPEMSDHHDDIPDPDRGHGLELMHHDWLPANGKNRFRIPLGKRVHPCALPGGKDHTHAIGSLDHEGRLARTVHKLNRQIQQH